MCVGEGKVCVTDGTSSPGAAADGPCKPAQVCLHHGPDWPQEKLLQLALCVQESDNVRSALLMEQAALGLLQTAPASLRKFAFTMVLAGLKYLNFSQRTLGIRCYL